MQELIIKDLIKTEFNGSVRLCMEWVWKQIELGNYKWNNTYTGIVKN